MIGSCPWCPELDAPDAPENSPVHPKASRWKATAASKDADSTKRWSKRSEGMRMGFAVWRLRARADRRLAGGPDDRCFITQNHRSPGRRGACLQRKRAVPKQAAAAPNQRIAGPHGPSTLNNSSSTQARRPLNGGCVPLNAMTPAMTARIAPAATSDRTIHLIDFNSSVSTTRNSCAALFSFHHRCETWN